MIKKWLIDYLKKCNYKSFIDIGCGLGETAGTIKKVLPDVNVTGIDIAENYIEKAVLSYPDVKFKVIDVRKLEFKPHSFDVAHTNGVLIHIPHEDIEKVIQGILWMARVGIFLESQGKETAGLLAYDPKEYWNGRANRDKPDNIDRNTQYYFAHKYEAIFRKLKLNYKIIKDWRDGMKTRLYKVWKESQN